MKKLICSVVFILSLLLLVSCNDGDVFHSHNFGEWETTTEPSCVEIGKRIRYCDCGENQIEDIVALGHEYNNGICSRCSCVDNESDLSQIEYSEGLSFTLSEDENYYIVTGIGTCTDSDIVVPLEYESLPVKEIAPLAFSGSFDAVFFEKWNRFVANMESGKDKEIPEEFCTVNSITIFGNITNIDQSLFRYTFPKQINVVDSEYYSSEDGVLYSVDKKTLIYYPARKEGENFVISDRTEKINSFAFIFSSKLENIVIPDHITSIDEAAFAFFASLKNVQFSKNITSIGNYAFFSCPSIKSLSLPQNLKTIGNNAFDYCHSLENIVIPDSVIGIGEFAFFDCTSLKSVEIGGALDIGNRAFDGCYRLVEVINKSSLDIVAGSEDYGQIANYAIEVHSGESKLVNVNDYFFYTFGGVNYLVDYSGNNTQLVLPQSYNGEKYEINCRAFCSYDSLTSVVIPDSVTKIGETSFAFCNSLTNVVISDGVVSIGRFAFEKSTSLTSVTIPNSVTSIGLSAFNTCNQLKNVYYTGTEAEWLAIKIDDCNGALTSCKIHYNYSSN